MQNIYEILFHKYTKHEQNKSRVFIFLKFRKQSIVFKTMSKKGNGLKKKCFLFHFMKFINNYSNSK